MLREHRKHQLAQKRLAGDDWEEWGLIFSTQNGIPVHARSLYRNFKQLIADAGLPDIRFHDLRHTAASLMLNQGIPILIVSKRLGHARPSITLDIYGHLIPSMQGPVAEVMDELITPLLWKTVHPVAPGSDFQEKSRKKPPPYIGKTWENSQLAV